MEKIIVNKWTEIQVLGGVQIYKFSEPETAFKYAIEQYEPFGYSIAYYSKDLKVLIISKI